MNIPAVKKQEVLIEGMSGDEFWGTVSVVSLQGHRLALRELMQFIDKTRKTPLYTNFTDEFVKTIRETEFPLGFNDLEPYRKRIEKFVRDNQNNITIHRIKNNKPITRKELDELEGLILTMDGSLTREAFDKALDGQTLGQFIRSIVGLDTNAAKEAFAEFLRQRQLTADQQTFINRLINFLSVRGTIEQSLLFDVPFTDINHAGITGVFSFDDTEKVIGILNQINKTATAV
jgi:type I restriction enzyme, R subunit